MCSIFSINMVSLLFLSTKCATSLLRISRFGLTTPLENFKPFIISPISSSLRWHFLDKTILSKKVFSIFQSRTMVSSLFIRHFRESLSLLSKVMFLSLKNFFKQALMNNAEFVTISLIVSFSIFSSPRVSKAINFPIKMSLNRRSTISSLEAESRSPVFFRWYTSNLGFKVSSVTLQATEFCAGSMINFDVVSEKLERRMAIRNTVRADDRCRLLCPRAARLLRNGETVYAGAAVGCFSTTARVPCCRGSSPPRRTLNPA